MFLLARICVKTYETNTINRIRQNHLFIFPYILQLHLLPAIAKPCKTPNEKPPNTIRLGPKHNHNRAVETQSGQQANICVWLRPRLLVLDSQSFPRKMSNVKVSCCIQYRNYVFIRVGSRPSDRSNARPIDRSSDVASDRAIDR